MKILLILEVDVNMRMLAVRMSAVRMSAAATLKTTGRIRERFEVINR